MTGNVIPENPTDWAKDEYVGLLYGDNDCLLGSESMSADVGFSIYMEYEENQWRSMPRDRRLQVVNTMIQEHHRISMMMSKDMSDLQEEWVSCLSTMN